MIKVSRSLTLATFLLLAPLDSTVAVGASIKVQTPSFNPSAGDSVGLLLRTDLSESTSVFVLGPDGDRLSSILTNAPLDPGTYLLHWDGKDTQGVVVPDEAYTFSLELGRDREPIRTTLESGDITSATFSKETGTLVYSLPFSSRVLIRLGIKNGPMLKTLVDWRPRTGGSVTEYWDGWDENRVLNLREMEGFTVLIMYEALPPATVITFGNPESKYRDWKRAQPIMTQMPIAAEEKLQRVAPPAWKQSPSVTLTFPEARESLPTIVESALVRVSVDSEDVSEFLTNPFEIIFYVDGLFFAEAEQGHIPFNWMWEVSELLPGEHVLTVNVVSFEGDVGVASRKVIVGKDR